MQFGIPDEPHHEDLDMIAVIGTSGWRHWLAEACKKLQLHLCSKFYFVYVHARTVNMID